MSPCQHLSTADVMHSWRSAKAGSGRGKGFIAGATPSCTTYTRAKPRMAGSMPGVELGVGDGLGQLVRNDGRHAVRLRVEVGAGLAVAAPLAHGRAGRLAGTVRGRPDESVPAEHRATHMTSRAADAMVAVRFTLSHRQTGLSERIWSAVVQNMEEYL